MCKILSECIRDNLESVENKEENFKNPKYQNSQIT